MAEDLNINIEQPKSARYEELIPQIKALIEGETDEIANLANVCAALKEAFGFFWVGFYLVKHEQLVLGPFQGPVACTRINLGAGVCGKAWQLKETLIVPDVDAFPGHIACSSASKSEIVLPLIKAGEVILILDVDSDQLDAFDEDDKCYLTQIIELL